ASVLGEGWSPKLFAVPSPEPQPFAHPSAPLTRHEDKRAALIRMVNDEAQPEASQMQDPIEMSMPALGLSKAFDSFDATMRLAALTGMEKELDAFSETQKVARLKALSKAKRAGRRRSNLADSSTWRNETATSRMDTGGRALSGPSLRYIWIGSVVLALAATVMLIVR
ncbi:MAG: hypothetical protein ACREUQ_08290, partial [Burkholderiales bacterium]